MNPADRPRPTAAQLRRRIRAAEALRLKTCEVAAAEVIAARQAAQATSEARKHADTALKEAVAAALRVFDDPDLLAELVGLPRSQLERSAKSVPVARAAELAHGLRIRASHPRNRASNEESGSQGARDEV
ncbi:hypothetical protein [Streptomyces sp. NPDC048172]|uniref:hypothetical protein n=1 Tax=Streptomyces sp. NPDC048172 TaxID=3365505 RepID=UPI00371A6950